MSSVDAKYDFSLDINVPNNPATRHYKELGGAIGGKMASAEKNLFDAFKSGDEGQIQQSMVVYQKWQRLMELFTTIIKSLHDLMMSIIRKLAL